MTGRRDFGTVRLLGTGRYQARYVDRSGRRHARSFATKGDATRFLSGARVDLDRGDWVDPKDLPRNKCGVVNYRSVVRGRTV